MEDNAEPEQINIENTRIKLQTHYSWSNARVWQLLAIALALTIWINNIYFSEIILALWLATVIILEPTYNKVSVRKAIGAAINTATFSDDGIEFRSDQDQIATFKFADILELELFHGLKQKYAGNFLFQTKYIKRALTVCVKVSPIVTFQIYTDDYSQFEKLKIIYSGILKRKS